MSDQVRTLPRNTPATERLIDACFSKMNAVYGGYNFTPENWAEMFKHSTESTKKICDIERLAPEELTYGNLREYYELHINVWKSYHARTNKLSDRLKKITQTP